MSLSEQHAVQCLHEFSSIMNSSKSVEAAKVFEAALVPEAARAAVLGELASRHDLAGALVFAIDRLQICEQANAAKEGEQALSANYAKAHPHTSKILKLLLPIRWADKPWFLEADDKADKLLYVLSPGYSAMLFQELTVRFIKSKVSYCG